MKTYDTLLNSVYKKNVFSETEKKKITALTKIFIKTLEQLLKKHNIKATVFLGGSSAKGTFLKGTFDCDIFVRFDYKTYSSFTNELSDILETVIEEATEKKAARVHGSRDYFQYEPSNIAYDMMFEIIPVLNVTNPALALNVTDMSPLHVLWIKKHLDKKPNLIREIIVTKLFLKSVGLYGAESYIRGFSGHVVDILIIHYGSFMELMKQVISWKKGLLIDVAHHFSNEKKALLALNESKFGPLILIDPVQMKRNAAASLSPEKFELFKEKALAFFSNPNVSYFVKKKFSLSTLKQKSVVGTTKFLFEAKSLDGKNDVVGSKLLKVYEYMLKRLKMHDFEVINSNWYWDKKESAYFWFFVSNASVREVKKTHTLTHKGPPIHKKLHVSKFKEKHEFTFVEQKHICAKKKREYLTPSKLLQDVINKAYISERVKSIRNVKK